MTSVKKTIYGLEASKYPARFCQPWKEEEVNRLLELIQQNTSIELIAAKHERTVGGIKSQLNKLAVTYFNQKRSMKDIIHLTGLTEEQVEDAILKSSKPKTKPEPKAKPTIVSDTVDIKEVVLLLKDIQSKLDILLAK